MIYPAIKAYRNNFRQSMFEPASFNRPFLGRRVQDLYWPQNKQEDQPENKRNTFALEIAMPDFNKEEIKVTIDKDTIIVRGEQKRTTSATSEAIVQEVKAMKTERKFKLSKSFDKEQVKAAFKDGVLTIRLIEMNTVGSQAEMIRRARNN